MKPVLVYSLTECKIATNTRKKQEEAMMTKSIFTNNYQMLLKLLIAVRKKAGITQQELAKKLGKNQSYISKYENSERRLDMIEVIAIMKAMDSNPVELMDNILKEWKE